MLEALSDNPDKINHSIQITNNRNSQCCAEQLSKSYSGILGSNQVYSSFFEQQELNLNKSELNLDKQKFSHSASNNFVDVHTKRAVNNSVKRRSSTFKAVASSRSSSSEHSSLINKLGSKLMEKACDKSFLQKSRKLLVKLADSEAEQEVLKNSFMSHRASDNILNKRESKKALNKTKTSSAFLANTNEILAKKGGVQTNYLKHLDSFKSKRGFVSMNSIFDKVNAVSTWSRDKTLNTSRHRVDKKVNLFSDAAVQTSTLVSEGSSFNTNSNCSQITTTLMQTNNFGSILAVLGSASTQRSHNATNSNRMFRQRAYSDGNRLSESVSSGDSPNGRHLTSPNAGNHTASFSKLVFI